MRSRTSVSLRTLLGTTALGKGGKWGQRRWIYWGTGKRKVRSPLTRGKTTARA